MVHLDIVKSQQWMTVTSRKFRGKARASSSNVVSIFTRETEEDVTSLTSIGDEESAFVADRGAPPTLNNQSDRQYLKQHGGPVVNSLQPAEEVMEQSMTPSVEKQKNL